METSNPILELSTTHNNISMINKIIYNGQVQVVLTPAMTKTISVDKCQYCTEKNISQGYQNTATHKLNINISQVSLWMCLGALKYFEAPKCIRSENASKAIWLLHFTQNIKFHNCQSTTKVHTSWTSTSVKSVFECIWSTRTHYKSNSTNDYRKNQYSTCKSEIKSWKAKQS